MIMRLDESPLVLASSAGEFLHRLRLILPGSVLLFVRRVVAFNPELLVEMTQGVP